MAAQPGRKLIRLEALRGFAAAYVVLHHANLFGSSRWRIFTSFGQEAVMMFFLISGFVIYHSTLASGRPVRARTYFIHRARRIYPLFLCALVVSYIVQSVDSPTLHETSAGALIGHLFMLQDVAQLKPGVWVNVIFTNGPLWSLSYEWWFYTGFFFITSLSVIAAAYRKYLVFTISLAGVVTYLLIPNQASLFCSYFLVWWAGAEVAREYLNHGTVTLRRQAPIVGMLGLLLGLWLVPVVRAFLHHEHLLWSRYPVLQVRHFGIALVMLVCGLTWYRLRFRHFDRVFGPFAVVAPISYAIYVLHYPLLEFMKAHVGAPKIVVVACMLAVLIPLAYALEVKLQPRINAVADRVEALVIRRRALEAQAHQPTNAEPLQVTE